MGIMNIGTRAMQANQLALETAGNNIANVNTKGYSRQNVVLQVVEGQFTGAGYVGKGVDVLTIQRNFSAFLTRQATLASATQSADITRADNLKQLETIFASGSSGLGASISEMLNAFSDVASAPTDLTARTVVLTRVDEAAARMRATSQSLDDLQQNVTQSLEQKAVAINNLAQSIAAINNDISRTQGNGQTPNDLLDRREQLVRELNQYVQTTSVAASDGTVGIFIAASQALVLGASASSVSIVSDDFGDPLKSKLAISSGGQTSTLDEDALEGGEVAGLLRFQNKDLNEGRNLLGRITLGVTTAMNDQHKLGLDLDGNVGGNIFSAVSFETLSIFEPIAPARLNTGDASLGLAISDPSQFAASDYEVNFNSDTTGSIIRRSDGT
ncbi:MAG: flagellar hook-associated protein FlgK, partial [Rhodoferax sp.]|nr:flagellar hook-associated protein FlgK [Rhodoferax sp.]